MLKYEFFPKGRGGGPGRTKSFEALFVCPEAIKSKEIILEKVKKVPRKFQKWRGGQRLLEKNSYLSHLILAESFPNWLTEVNHRDASALECFTSPFFLKKIRGTRQTANYLYTFHSSPKHLPKVKSRGLDHSGKCFFMWFFMWFCKKNVEKLVLFEITCCFDWLPTFVEHTKAFWTLNAQETLI